MRLMMRGNAIDRSFFNAFAKGIYISSGTQGKIYVQVGIIALQIFIREKKMIRCYGTSHF